MIVPDILFEVVELRPWLFGTRRIVHGTHHRHSDAWEQRNALRRCLMDRKRLSFRNVVHRVFIATREPYK